ncbi:MAG: AAC(3) family N-acetyltransferase [Ruminococcaceae bacterium]|nr:AAC(3) family N-acetyltransferase [Oscillospiraceae bacterium]
MNNKDYTRLKEDLLNLGIKSGDDIIVHSAYKKLGGVDGGIETVIKALISVVGDSGTLLFPTLSHRFVNPSPPVNNPVFDVRNTPSCVGAMANVFMTFEGVKCSLHPTHSACALGARQDEYIKGHELDDEPVGPNSPFFKLGKLGGKILFLGCSTDSNTSMHGVEEYASAPYVLSKDTKRYVMIDELGNRIEKDYRYHYISQNGFAQRYSRLENLMEFKRGNVLEAPCAVVDCRTMWDVGVKKIKQDTYYFVEKI